MSHTPNNSVDLESYRQNHEKGLSAEERNADHVESTTMEDLRRELKREKIQNEIQAEELAKSRAETADALEKLKDLFDNAPTNYFDFSADGTISALNFAAAKLAGAERDGLVDTNFKPLLSVLDRTRFHEYLKRVFNGGAAESFEVAISKDGCDAIHIVVESVLSADGKLARANVFDVSDQQKADADRQVLAADLEIALEEVKLLNGLLPICVTCKKIRDESGAWSEVEVYVAKHSEATFSHGICPNCFPEFRQ